MVDDLRHADVYALVRDFATLVAFSDEEVVVTLNNWNFQSDKATAIKVLETSTNPIWCGSGSPMGMNMQSPSSNGSTPTCPTHSSSCRPNLTWPALCAVASLTVMCRKLMVWPVRGCLSSFRKLAKASLFNYFSLYALCDAPAQFRVGPGKAASNSGFGDCEFESAWPVHFAMLWDVRIAGSMHSAMTCKPFIASIAEQIS